MLAIVLFSSVSYAQFNISGKVTSATSQTALPSATVLIKNTNLTTVSDINGYYQFQNLKKDSYLLQVSYIGYKTKDIKVELNANTSLDIILEEDVYLQEEVIIKASKLTQNIPSTFTEIDKEKISKLNYGMDIPVLLQYLPAIVTSSDAGNGFGYTALRIRGSDITRINVTVNGIPVNDAESQGVFWVNMPDFASSVDNIQVQRGVGLSTNGPAAFGGGINFQTSKMNPERYASYDLKFGSFNSFKHSLCLGTGLLKNHFAFDIRLSKINSNGYIERAKSDLKSLFFNGGYYGKKDILKLVIYTGKEKTYQAWMGVPKDSLRTNRRYNPFTYENQTDNYQQDNYQLLYSHQFSKVFRINSALHYTKGKGYYEEFRENESFSTYSLPFPVFGNDTIKSTDFIRQKWLDNDFYGMTFSSTYDNAGKLEIISGFAMNQYYGRHFGKIIKAGISLNIPENYQWHRYQSLKNECNAFVKVNYKIGNKFNTYLDLQYRYIFFKLIGFDALYRNVAQNHPFHFFNPKAGFVYQFNQKNKMYLTLAYANREPNGNNFADADISKNMPKPEKLLNTELGYEFNSNFFNASANLYYMYYINQLVLTGTINDVGYPVMTNVNSSFRTGLEIETNAKLFRIVNWNLNTSLSQNKILNFTEYIDDWDNGGQIVNKIGTTNIAFSPDLVLTNNFTFTLINQFTASVITRYISRQFIDNTSDKDRSLKPYTTSDLLLEYVFKAGPIRQIKASLMLNNIFSRKYENNAWVYRYYFNGTYQTMDGYFPQAGISFMGGFKIMF